MGSLRIHISMNAETYTSAKMKIQIKGKEKELTIPEVLDLVLSKKGVFKFFMPSVLSKGKIKYRLDRFGVLVQIPKGWPVYVDDSPKRQDGSPAPGPLFSIEFVTRKDRHARFIVRARHEDDVPEGKELYDPGQFLDKIVEDLKTKYEDFKIKPKVAASRNGIAGVQKYMYTEMFGRDKLYKPKPDTPEGELRGFAYMKVMAFKRNRALFHIHVNMNPKAYTTTRMKIKYKGKEKELALPQLVDLILCSKGFIRFYKPPRKKK